MFTAVNNNTEIMRQLTYLGVGMHGCGWRKGFIEITGGPDKYEVMWTTHQTTHDPLSGPAISVEFMPDGIGWIFRSALTMHKVREEDNWLHLAECLKKKITQAYNKKEGGKEWKSHQSIPAGTNRQQRSILCVLKLTCSQLLRSIKRRMIH